MKQSSLQPKSKDKFSRSPITIVPFFIQFLVRQVSESMFGMKTVSSWQAIIINSNDDTDNSPHCHCCHCFPIEKTKKEQGGQKATQDGNSEQSNHKSLKLWVRVEARLLTKMTVQLSAGGGSSKCTFFQKHFFSQKTMLIVVG